MIIINKRRRTVLVFLAFCLLAGMGALCYLKLSTSAFAGSVREAVKAFAGSPGLPQPPDLTKGLAVTEQTVFVDGFPGPMPDCAAQHDVKIIYTTPEGQVFCDCASGFAVALPAGMSPDLSLSPKFVRFDGPGAGLVIGRDWASCGETSEYIAYYYYRFLLDPSYRANNGIELLEHTKTDGLERLTVRVNGLTGKFDTYTYLDFLTGTREFYHAMVKYDTKNPEAAGFVQRIADSFRYFRPAGTAVYRTEYRPLLPDEWTGETRALYEKIASSDTPLWGIFTRDVTGSGIHSEIPGIEKKLGYKFDIVLAYTGLDGGFPSAFMERCANEGRLVELTLQATVSNNTDLYGPSPWLELYRTGDDPRIRAFARAARDFGRPFLFRLNNEMNSDWVSYGGVVNLLDPGIHAENWRTVYRIFEEEGVRNAIWIFNPHDRDYPPNPWNFQAAYYPGNQFVHLYGVTGYNNGTYYQEVWGESWREFSEIYDRIQEEASGLYGAFPWVITEFASSSVGGDKAKWIDGMFESLWKYPNIKAAVWFSYADFDPRDNKMVSRPYWLDETDATTEAFRRGLAGMTKARSARPGAFG